MKPFANWERLTQWMRGVVIEEDIPVTVRGPRAMVTVKLVGRQVVLVGYERGR